MTVVCPASVSAKTMPQGLPSSEPQPRSAEWQLILSDLRSLPQVKHLVPLSMTFPEPPFHYLQLLSPSPRRKVFRERFLFKQARPEHRASV